MHPSVMERKENKLKSSLLFSLVFECFRNGASVENFLFQREDELHLNFPISSTTAMRTHRFPLGQIRLSDWLKFHRFHKEP